MKALKKVFSIAGIATFATVFGFYVYNIIAVGFRKFCDIRNVFSTIGFVLLILLLVSLFIISLSCLIGKKGNVGFILACFATIGTIVTTFIQYGETRPIELVLVSVATFALLVHIFKVITRIKFLSFISGISLAFPLFYLKGFVAPLFGAFKVLCFACFALSILAYVIAPFASSRSHERSRNKRLEQKFAKEVGKQTEEEENHSTEDVIVKSDVSAPKGKKFREWTDENGFTYTNLP